ncbi:hypothetical protein BH11PSE7_BH11PSE7_22660 [soil metagenome]
MYTSPSNPRPVVGSRPATPPLNRPLARSQDNLFAIAAVLAQVDLPDLVIDELAQLGLVCRPDRTGAATPANPQDCLNTIEDLLNKLCNRARAQGKDSYRAAAHARDTVMMAVMDGATSVTVDLPGGLAARLAQLGLTCHPVVRDKPAGPGAPGGQEAPQLAAALAVSRHVVRDDPNKSMKGMSGAPRLLQALTQGDAAAVTAFMERLKDAELDQHQVASIVQARRTDKTPGLYCALLDGNAAAVAAFMKGVKGLGLNTQQLADIAAARDASGLAGLYQAMHDGRASAVAAFMNGVMDLGLGPQQIADVVVACDLNGNPGLSAALYHGKASVVTAYMAGLQCLCLVPQQIASIAQAKDGAGRSALHIALRDGRAASVPAYLEGLKGLGLDAAQVTTIALAKDLHGCSGLCLALHGGHTAAVTAFMNALMDQGLAPQQVAEIAQARDQGGRNGLELARERGYAATEKAYVEGLARLQQRKLITAQQAADMVMAPGKPRW